MEVVIEDVDRRVRARRGREVVVGCLTSETVKGAALSLESVDDIERSDGLSLSVLSVGYCITDNTLEEGLQNTTGLFVDHCDALECDQVQDGDATHWLRYA